MLPAIGQIVHFYPDVDACHVAGFGLAEQTIDELCNAGRCVPAMVVGLVDARQVLLDVRWPFIFEPDVGAESPSCHHVAAEGRAAGTWHRCSGPLPPIPPWCDTLRDVTDSREPLPPMEPGGRGFPGAAIDRQRWEALLRAQRDAASPTSAGALARGFPGHTPDLAQMRFPIGIVREATEILGLLAPFVRPEDGSPVATLDRILDLARAEQAAIPARHVEADRAREPSPVDEIDVFNKFMVGINGHGTVTIGNPHVAYTRDEALLLAAWLIALADPTPGDRIWAILAAVRRA
jgi:hypothetical protein